MGNLDYPYRTLLSYPAVKAIGKRKLCGMCLLFCVIGKRIARYG